MWWYGLVQGKNAITLAPWGFKKGEQVFENYGQPNSVYFTYHGFVLDSNTHDCTALQLGVNSLTPATVQEVSPVALSRLRL